MRRLLISLMILTLSLILAQTVKVAFIDKNLGIPVIKEYEVEKDQYPVDVIFKHLYNPPGGLISYVPSGILRAAYLLDDTIVLDLYSTPTSDMGFYEERIMLYQILFSIFRSFNVDKVYISVDGGKKDYLGRFIDVSLGFLRKDWLSWPVEVNGD